MEESYFAAFFGNAKEDRDRLARRRGHRSEFTPTDGDRKLRPRSGTTNPGANKAGGGTGTATGTGSNSLPSIPSFAERAQHRLDVGGDAVVDLRNQRLRPHGVHRQLRSTASALAELEARRATTNPVMLAPSRSEHDVTLVVVGILLVAVVILGFVIFGGATVRTR